MTVYYMDCPSCSTTDCKEISVFLFPSISIFYMHGTDNVSFFLSKISASLNIQQSISRRNEKWNRQNLSIQGNLALALLITINVSYLDPN